MEDGSGLELALLEGIDEDLLERLYRAGIRTRGDLSARIAIPDGRRDLARELGVSPRRLQILHHLNFLLPEERAERELDLERRVRENAEKAGREMRQVWRISIVSLVVVFASVLLSLFLTRPERFADPARTAALESRTRELEASVDALLPIGRAHAEERVLSGMSSLGPAPGWVAPRPWPEATHVQIARLLGDDPSAMPPRAVSLLLTRLWDLESAPGDTLTPFDRAMQAANMLSDFPPPASIGTVWDAAAVLLRTRLRGRALGLSPPEDLSLPLDAAGGWEWTSAGFLTCEELLARLESMPVREEALPVWSQTLVQIRSAADIGRDERRGLPEAFARDYWLRRAELEYAVIAALLGRTHCLPYHETSPRAFLETRRQYLDGAIRNAPPAARLPLAWLAVEYEEGLALAAWLAEPEHGGTGSGRGSWIEALQAVEAARAAAPGATAPGIEAAVARAAALSGSGGPAWSAPRTRFEGGLRPLLMVTRARGRAPSGASPSAS